MGGMMGGGSSFVGGLGEMLGVLGGIGGLSGFLGGGVGVGNLGIVLFLIWNLNRNNGLVVMFGVDFGVILN